MQCISFVQASDSTTQSRPGPFTCPHTAQPCHTLYCSLQAKARSRVRCSSSSSSLTLQSADCRPRSAGQQVAPVRPPSPHGRPPPGPPAAAPRRRHHGRLVPVAGRRAVRLPLRRRRASPHLFLRRSKPLLQEQPHLHLARRVPVPVPHRHQAHLPGRLPRAHPLPIPTASSTSTHSSPHHLLPAAHIATGGHRAGARRERSRSSAHRRVLPADPRADAASPSPGASAHPRAVVDVLVTSGPGARHPGRAGASHHCSARAGTQHDEADEEEARGGCPARRRVPGHHHHHHHRRRPRPRPWTLHRRHDERSRAGLLRRVDDGGGAGAGPGGVADGGSVRGVKEWRGHMSGSREWFDVM